jgi:hypothetical protein
MLSTKKIVSDVDQHRLEFLAEEMVEKISEKEITTEVLRHVQRDNDEILSILEKYDVK